MHARLARYEIPVEALSEAVGHFATYGSQLAEIEGFEGGYVLLDEEEGSLVTLTLWASRAALETSESRASRLRRQACQEAGGSVQSIRSYEVTRLAAQPAANET